jgi:hypothetical protein
MFKFLKKTKIIRRWTAWTCESCGTVNDLPEGFGIEGKHKYHTGCTNKECYQMLFPDRTQYFDYM